MTRPVDSTIIEDPATKLTHFAEATPINLHDGENPFQMFAIRVYVLNLKNACNLSRRVLKETLPEEFCLSKSVPVLKTNLLAILLAFSLHH